MHFSKILYILFLFQFALISSRIYEYNMTLGHYSYVTDIAENNIYRFYLQVDYLLSFRVQFMTDLTYNMYPIEKETILIKETNKNNSIIYNEHTQYLNSANSLVKYNHDGIQAEIFFTYYIRNINTTLLIFEFTSLNYFRRYIYLDTFLPEKYELSPNINYNFTNITNYYPYIFFLKDVKKYQLISINISTNDKSKDDIFVQEYGEALVERKKIILYMNSMNRYTYNKLYTSNYIYPKQSSSPIGILYFLYKSNEMNHFLNIKFSVTGEQYFFDGYNDTIKVLKNIEPNFTLCFWIKATKIQKLNITLKYSSSQNQENPINDLEIYEHIFPNISSRINCYKILKILPDENKDNKLLETISYKIDSIDTNYVLLKITPEKYIEYFEIEVNIEGHIYDFINNNENNEKNLVNIKANNPIYFFVNATIYNKIFVNLSYDNKYISPINYINISEYENRKNISFIKSTIHEVKINKINNNECNIEFSYIPSLSKTKLVAFKFESNTNMDFLKARINIGGEYVEIHNNNTINLSKIIAGGSIYYFLISVPIFKKVDMNIIINDDNINNNINIGNNRPFTYVDIYEKKNKDDISFDKYFNKTFLSKIKNNKLNEYFTYIVESFNTKYILLKLKSNINIENILIKIDISNSLYDLSKDNNIYFDNILPDMPYYFKIDLIQYQQANINLNMNYLQENPYNLVQIYELSNINKLNEYRKYSDLSMKFSDINNNHNCLSNSFSYTANSIYTSLILVKIIFQKNNIKHLNINISIGGGRYEIEKGILKNITNLLPTYDYYFFFIASKGEKLNIKLSLTEQNKAKPFTNLEIYEYSNKITSSFYLYNINKKIETEIIDNKLINFFSFRPKNNSTNFIALKVKPAHYINFIECLVESDNEKGKEKTSISLVAILFIVLGAVFLFFAVIFIVYIKKFHKKSSSINIEGKSNSNNQLENKVENGGFELALLPEESISTSN